MEMNLPKRKDVKTESPIEDIMLREFHLLGVYPEMQYQIGKYRVDFAFPEKLIVVECDGKEWHSSEEQKLNDQIRDDWLSKNGWYIYRITGSEIFRNSDLISKIIMGKKIRVKHQTIDFEEIDYEVMNPDHIEEIKERNKEIKLSNLEMMYKSNKNYGLTKLSSILSERFKHKIF